jgi:hypothetical protein
MGLSCKFSLKPIQWHGEIMGNHGKSQWKSQWKIQVRGALSPAAAFTATPGAWRWALFFFNEQTMTNIYLLIYDTYIWHISCKWHIWCLYISFDIYIYMIYIYIYLSLSIVYITISYYIYIGYLYMKYLLFAYLFIWLYLAVVIHLFILWFIHTIILTHTYLYIHTNPLLICLFHDRVDDWISGEWWCCLLIETTSRLATRKHQLPNPWFGRN